MVPHVSMLYYLAKMIAGIGGGMHGLPSEDLLNLPQADLVWVWEQKCQIISERYYIDDDCCT